MDIQGLKSRGAIASRAYRMQWVDVARLIALYSVAVAHSHIANSPIIYFQAIWTIPLLFYLAGVTTKVKPLKIELSRLVRSLLVPYVCLYLMCYLYDNATRFIGWLLHSPSMFIERAPDIVEAMLGIVLGNTAISKIDAAPLWFLLALFWCRLLYALVVTAASYVARPKDSRYYMIQLMVCIACNTLAIVLDGVVELRLPCEINTSLIVYPYFVLGTINVVGLDSLLTMKGKAALMLRGALAIVMLLATLYILRVNGLSSIASLDWGRYPILCYVGGLTGIASILGLSSLVSLPKALDIYSHNTIIIMGAHWSIIPTIGKVIEGLVPGFERDTKTVAQGLIVAFLGILLSIVPIYIITRYLPFILGRGTKPSAYRERAIRSSL